MSQHNEQITLRQILDLAIEAVDLYRGRSTSDFVDDRLWCLAMERLVLNVGEAAKRVSSVAQSSVTSNSMATDHCFPQSHSARI
jgi:uncharacterized protein with HEPN domain